MSAPPPAVIPILVAHRACGTAFQVDPRATATRCPSCKLVRPISEFAPAEAPTYPLAAR